MRLSSLCLALALVAPAAAAEQQAGDQSQGIVVERIRASIEPTAKVGNRIITLVRVDPARFAFRFLSEGHEGERRPLPQWVEDLGLAGGINAGMFLPDGRSVGFMMAKGIVRSARTPRRYDGAIAFDPIGDLPPFAVGGAGCPHDLAWLRSHYGSVLQGYRMMVDCSGRAVEWRNSRRYSAAALGVDRNGHAVLVHSRTPYRMSLLNQMLADQALGLRGLVYMEGGPEASLVVETAGVSVREVGSYEDDFMENDDNQAFWDLPNVVGFAPRP